VIAATAITAGSFRRRSADVLWVIGLAALLVAVVAIVPSIFVAFSHYDDPAGDIVRAWPFRHL